MDCVNRASNPAVSSGQGDFGRVVPDDVDRLVVLLGRVGFSPPANISS